LAATPRATARPNKGDGKGVVWEKGGMAGGAWLWQRPGSSSMMAPMRAKIMAPCQTWSAVA